MRRTGWMLAGLFCLQASLAAASRGVASPDAASPAASPPDASGGGALRAAADRAAALLASEQWQDPLGFLLCDFLHRRFSIQALASSARRFGDFRAAHPEVAWVDVFRRLIDPALQPKREWLQDGPGSIRGLDRVTVPALYCDRAPVPADYGALLEKARSEGGYSLTHAALALVWLRENGCQVVDRAFEKRVIRETAALVRADSALSDLELEAAAIVAHLGHSSLLPDRFIDEVLATQQPGGGWAEDGGSAHPADWHPTVLALWFLLEADRPGRTEPMLSRP